MPMSLKCMIDKWLHKGQISQEEHDAVMKKLKGHDKQIMNDAIEEYKKKIEFEEKWLFDCFERLQAIPKFDDRGVEHYGECPCGGKIAAIRSTYNGHLRARCDKCKFSLME